MTVAKFHALLLAVIVGLFVATLGVIAAGDRTEPAPLTVQPGEGEQGVPATSSIVLRFGRPVDRDAVAAALVIEPPTAGSLEIDRAVVRFMPAGGLRSGSRYTLTLRSGFQDQTGRVLRHDRRYAFDTRPARLVFSRPEANAPEVLAPRNLWVASLDGSQPGMLSREPLGILFAAVAPDGERVVYSAPNPAAPDSSGLWIVNMDGSGRQQLTGDLDGAILSVGWSPRGDLIAYERRAVVGVRGELGRPRILAIRPDGGGGGLLYGRADEAGSQPVWSPDGRRLLIAEAGRGGRAIVDPAGQPVLIPGGGTDSGSWSPDGRQIAYADLVQERDVTRSVIRVVDSSGAQLIDLARPGYSDTAPAWAPGGHAVAVVGRHDDGDSAIWLLDPSGGAARQIVLPAASSSAQLTPPVWTAGGELLAFSRLAPRPSAPGRPPPVGALDWELWVARGDGSEARRLPVDGLAEGWAP